MPYSTLQQAQDSALKPEDYLEVAAGIVQDLAPAPEPEPPDYAPKAARAERLLFRFLTTTDAGVLRSKNIGGEVSKSFNDDKQVRQIVADTMGSYFTSGAEASTGSSATAFIGPSPF